MSDVNGDCEGSSQGARAIVRVRYLVRCTGGKWFQLHLGSGYDVTVRAELNFRLTVRRQSC